MRSLGFTPIIGLEIHAQLLTQTKLFCSCKSDSDAPPNSLTCPVCLGLPGALPVLNQKAVEMGVKFALAVNSKINKRSVFERKNYFYPDLPKGYQITQHHYPLSQGGFIKIKNINKKIKIPIEQIHLEEDSGKSIHTNGLEQRTYLDFNRSGIPLLEIVTQPKINTPKQATQFLKKAIVTLQYLDICNGNMDQGSLRCDVNISIQKKDSKKKGPKIEIKNLNSFSFLQKALEYEIKRQLTKRKKGIPIEQETRFWDEKNSQTVLMRTKEETKDYRYFPEPDLAPLVITNEEITRIKKTIPESPDHKIDRFIKQYKIPSNEAASLASSKELSDYFEQTVKYCKAPSETSHWILREVLNYFNLTSTFISDFPVKPKQMAELIEHICGSRISRQTAKEIVFPEMIHTEKKVTDIVKEKKLSLISDEKQLKKIIKKIMGNNKNQVNQYLEGKSQVIKYLMGQVMKQTKGKADPKLTNNLLIEILDRYNK